MDKYIGDAAPLMRSRLPIPKGGGLALSKEFVNLASRLEGTSKLYGCDIAIGGNTYQACADRILVRELDIVRVKGKIQPVTIYELIGKRGDRISATKQQIMELYQQGRQLYLGRQFASAWQKFEAVLAIDRFGIRR